MKFSYGKLFSLAVHTALVVLAVWFLAIAILEDVALQARLARLAVALAFLANLFSGRERIKRTLLAFSVALVVMGTLIHIYK